MSSPPDKCIAAIKVLLKEHPNSVATYRPKQGGLVIVVNSPEVEDALMSFIEALEDVGMEMNMSTIGLLSSFLSETPEA